VLIQSHFNDKTTLQSLLILLNMMKNISSVIENQI